MDWRVEKPMLQALSPGLHTEQCLLTMPGTLAMDDPEGLPWPRFFVRPGPGYMDHLRLAELKLLVGSFGFWLILSTTRLDLTDYAQIIPDLCLQLKLCNFSNPIYRLWVRLWGILRHHDSSCTHGYRPNDKTGRFPLAAPTLAGLSLLRGIRRSADPKTTRRSNRYDTEYEHPKG